MLSALRPMLRGLARAPLFTVVAIFSLALGIGANTAIFSLLDQLLLRTLAVKNPSELVFLYDDGPSQGNRTTDESGGPAFSYPMFRELQKQQTPFTALAAAKNEPASLSYRNSAAPGVVRFVSGNYFDTLGVRTALGRMLGESDDDQPGAHPVAVLSHDYWVQRFGADPGALNQTLIVNGYAMTVVGVAHKGFLSERQGSPPDVYVPVSMREVLLAGWKGFDDRRSYWITLFGRMKPGVSLKRAELEINVPYRAQIEQDVQLLTRPKPDFLVKFKAKHIKLKPGEYGRGGIREERQKPMLLVLAMTGLVLLIACANVANLQLARGAARLREVSVRLALGASRAQLVRQLLFESCALAIAGGVLGLAAGRWTLGAALASLPASSGVTGYISPNLSIPVLVFCVALSIATGILFGLVPALQASRPDLIAALKNQAGQLSGSAKVFRKSLVTVQIAISLLLLISAGLFMRTLINLERAELGIRTDHLTTFSVVPRLNRYSEEQASAFQRALTEKLAAIPGVRLVSSTDVPAIANWWSSTSTLIEGFNSGSEDGSVSTNVAMIAPDYFRTVGTPLAAGREFTAADTATSPRVVIVNEAFARLYFAGRSAIGYHLGSTRNNNKTPNAEIVGVVKNAKYASMKEPVPPVYYTPLTQGPYRSQIFYYLRTAIDPARTATAIRQTLASLDPNMPVRDLKTMEAQIDENTFDERFMSTLIGSFAGLATALAAIGLYGVLAFNVARRTREIGIRMALGAKAGHVRGLVMREMVWMIAIGSAIGIGSAAAAGKLLQSYLFGMKPWDVFVYASAAGILAAMAFAASYVPARRASSVDPMIALRYE